MIKILRDYSQDELYENKRFHYWYGGDVVEMETDVLPGYKLIIAAVGDVKAVLSDLDENEVAYIKDRRNGGTFDALADYLKTDEDLEQALEHEHEEYLLEIEDANWWECVVIAPNGEYIEIGYTLDCYRIDEAVKEIIDNEYNIIEWIKDAL